MSYPALPNAFSQRIAADIARAREAPITAAEIEQLAADHGVAVQEVEAMAQAHGFNLRATADAVRRHVAREG